MMRLYLLTVENVLNANVGDLVRRLQGLPQRVMLRIPIQYDGGKMDDPADYKEAFDALHTHADLMIEFVDSAAATHLTPDKYRKHVEACLRELRKYCAVGEAGNEINGNNWKDGEGKHPHAPREVVRMVQSALKVCDEAKPKLPTAITYYLSTDEKPPMTEWIKTYASGLMSEYALISYYPNSADDAFTPEQMPGIFSEFRGAVSAPVIGWGEYGTEGDFSNVPKDGRNLVRQVEQDFWRALSSIRGYAGLGGYWDWGTQEYMDEVLQDVWR
jgi:hypothetical protein